MGILSLLFVPVTVAQIGMVRNYGRLHAGYVQDRQQLVTKLREVRRRDAEPAH